MSFHNYSVDPKTLHKNVQSIIKRRAGWANDVQTALFQIGARAEQHGDVSALTDLVLGISEGKLISSEGKQIARYMMAVLPIVWKKETQSFGLKKDREAFDWDEACAMMEAVRFDYYGAEPAEKAFEVEKEWKGLVAKVRRIINNTPEDQRESQAYKNAELIAKQFALEA
jgi:hypothetical protein